MSLRSAHIVMLSVAAIAVAVGWTAGCASSGDSQSGGPKASAMARKPTPAPGPDAGPPPAHNGTSYWIKLSAQQDGSFTVTNARNGFTKTYAAKR